jgi:signal peptidase I
MLGGYESYSLRRKSRLKPLLRLMSVLVLVVALHALITNVLVFSFRIDSVSMEPALKRGDRVLATPLAYGIPVPLLPPRMRSYGTPHRGELVVFEVPGSLERPWHVRLAETLLRFVTLNRHSLEEGPDGRPIKRLSVKRVIGLPGDTVRMERLRALVRPAGHTGFEPETQIVAGSYTVNAEPATEWPAGLPFAGDTEEIPLGAGEYFVLGDNRARSSDSRSWGVVPGSLIRGRTLLLYWPVTRFGRP